jgi:ketosteroid isomerase-like protein
MSNATADANLQIVKEIYGAFAAGDLDAFFARLDPAIVVIEAEGLPYAGRYDGIEGFQRLLKALDACWVDITCTDFNYVADAERVAVLFTLQGKSRKTGRPIAQPMCEVWELRNRRACRFSPFYYDTHAIRVACGLDD